MKNKIDKTISRNLTRLMEENNITQLELAEYIGVTQTTISNWCSGIKMPRMDKIDLICNYFRIPRSSLMEEHRFLNEDNAYMVRESTSPYFVNTTMSDIDKLISLYKSLNDEGKEKLMDHAELLSSSSLYKKCNPLDVEKKKVK